MKLKGKTAIITGSGRGLGKQLHLSWEAWCQYCSNDIPASDSIDQTAEEFKALE